MADDPADKWKSIRLSGRGDGRLEVPSMSTGIETGYGPALYAVGPRGEPRLLVPVAQATGGLDISSSPNMVAGPTILTQYGKSTTFFDVMVTSRHLDSVFADLVAEILRRLSDGDAPAKAISSTISEFRQLLLDGSGRKAPENAVLGLAGELLVLSKLTDLSSASVSSWVGPYEQRHDFRSGSRAIEVKTSSRSDSTAVTIHGADQLEPPGEGVMHLAHVRLERAQGGNITVGGLAERILASGGDSGALSAALMELGCDDPHSEAWNDQAFHLEALDLYVVNDEFPRLTGEQVIGGHLPHGIDNLSYKVDLKVAQDCKLSPSQASSIFSEFVS